jgi:hypothetical protein
MTILLEMVDVERSQGCGGVHRDARRTTPVGTRASRQKAMIPLDDKTMREVDTKRDADLTP